MMLNRPFYAENIYETCLNGASMRLTLATTVFALAIVLAGSSSAQFASSTSAKHSIEELELIQTAAIHPACRRVPKQVKQQQCTSQRICTYQNVCRVARVCRWALVTIFVTMCGGAYSDPPKDILR